MPPDLLGQMSSAARDDVLADPRWEDFARGALSEEETADLLARARAAGLDEETIEALGPRHPSFDDRLAEAALAALAAQVKPAADSRPSKIASEARPVRPASPAPANDAAPERSPQKPVARVIPLWARPPVLASVAAGLAAAAAALLWLGRPADLPVFSMAVEGGTQGTRLSSGDTGGVVSLAPGSRVVVTVRPEVAATRQFGARAYVYGPGKAFEWPGGIAVADTGAVRLIAPASELFRDAPAGRFKLCVVVGDAGSLPVSPGDSPPAPRAPGFVTVCRDLEWSAAAK